MPNKDRLKSSSNKLVLVKTSGRSVYDAVDRAFYALNLLCGLWSLFSTYGSWSFSFGTRQEPIGSIHTGPLHSLHRLNGELATDICWYDRASLVDNRLFKPQAGWQKIEGYRRWAMKRFHLLPFRKDVENLIVRYSIAMDQTDIDAAFLQMWSILEKITNTVGANYDETVRKAIWLYDDRQTAREFLECARLRRNLLVHSARSTEMPEQAAFLVESFVDPHLLRLVRNDFGISSLEEYGQHLSLPSDLPTLKREMKWIGKAIRIIRDRTPS